MTPERIQSLAREHGCGACSCCDMRISLAQAVAEAQRKEVLREIHEYQTKQMWDGAISFMKKDIPGYEAAIRAKE